MSIHGHCDPLQYSTSGGVGGAGGGAGSWGVLPSAALGPNFGSGGGGSGIDQPHFTHRAFGSNGVSLSMTATSTPAVRSPNWVDDNLWTATGILEDLAGLLRSERRRRRLSLRDVAKEASMTLSVVHNIEKSTKTPTVKTALELLYWVIQSRKLPSAW